jgi:hypothetical protein
MKHDPFNFAAFPTFGDIPDTFRAKYLKGYRRKNGMMEKKHRVMKRMWFFYFGDSCPSCGVKMTTDLAQLEKGHFATIDHILARSLGGHHKAWSNLTCVCRDCNSFKSGYECKISMLLWKGVSRKQAT